jgi:hypothetical protein
MSMTTHPQLLGHRTTTPPLDAAGCPGRVAVRTEVIGLKQRPQPAVGVFLTLVGSQEVSVQAHHENTDGAVIAVRLGKALLYLHDLDNCPSVCAGLVGAGHGGQEPPARDPPVVGRAAE